MTCKLTRKTVIVLTVFIIISLVATLGFLGILLNFDALVESKMAKSISISPTSTIYSNWVSPQTPVFFSIYLYNITNKDEIIKGQKPKLQQIGPYVYREKREKVNITWPMGDYSLVSFYLRITYLLDRELSVGNPDVDMVDGLSIPFAAISSNMVAGNGPTEGEYMMLTWFSTPSLFVTQSVTDYVWGYADEISSACNSLTPDKCPRNKVGVMIGKNGTNDGPFLMDTGVNDINRVGNILSYKGNSAMTVWPTPEANLIRGTDGSQMAPGITATSRRWIFSHDLCRSFEMRVLGPGKLTNSDKLKVVSLGGTPETAQHVSKNPANRGFCPTKTPGTTCPPEGLFDLSTCKQEGGTRPPIYSSMAHFYGADPILRQEIDGLPPADPETSATKLYVEPKTGMVLEAYKRLQINVYVNPSSALKDDFKNWTKPIMFPVSWFEEAAAADSKSLDMLYDNLYVLPVKGYYILLTLFGICLGLFLLLSFILLFCCFSRCCSTGCLHSSSSSSQSKPKTYMHGSEVLADVKYSKVGHRIDVSGPPVA